MFNFLPPSQIAQMDDVTRGRRVRALPLLLPFFNNGCELAAPGASKHK